MTSSSSHKWRLLVLQHHPAEHLGRFQPFIEADGGEISVVRLDAGETLPHIKDFDAVWALGGPMQVWEEEAYPWLTSEKAFIRDAVLVHGLPFLGLCLGHQLLAESLGGRIGMSKTPEVGVLPVELTRDGRESPFLQDIGDSQRWIQGHGAEVQVAPNNAQILARSPDCAIQAMSWGPKAISFQFHYEMTIGMVDGCLEHPTYAADFVATLGADGIARLREDTLASDYELDDAAKKLYRNWRDTVFRMGSLTLAVS